MGKSNGDQPARDERPDHPESSLDFLKQVVEDLKEANRQVGELQQLQRWNLELREARSAELEICAASRRLHRVPDSVAV